MKTLEQMLQEAQEISLKMDLVVLGVKSIVELTEAMEQLADTAVEQDDDRLKTMLEGAVLFNTLGDVMTKVDGLLGEILPEIDNELKDMFRTQCLEAIKGKEQYLVVALMLVADTELNLGGIL